MRKTDTSEALELTVGWRSYEAERQSDGKPDSNDSVASRMAIFAAESFARVAVLAAVSTLWAADGVDRREWVRHSVDPNDGSSVRYFVWYRDSNSYNDSADAAVGRRETVRLEFCDDDSRAYRTAALPMSSSRTGQYVESVSSRCTILCSVNSCGISDMELDEHLLSLRL